MKKMVEAYNIKRCDEIIDDFEKLEEQAYNLEGKYGIPVMTAPIIKEIKALIGHFVVVRYNIQKSEKKE